MHAWIHRNICNKSLHACYFYFSGDHTAPPPHSFSAFPSALCLGHVTIQTHTFPQAPSTKAHTAVHWQRHFRHDAKALRGHLPVSQPCHPDVLQGKQLMLHIWDTSHVHTHARARTRMSLPLFYKRINEWEVLKLDKHGNVITREHVCSLSYILYISWI